MARLGTACGALPEGGGAGGRFDRFGGTARYRVRDESGGGHSGRYIGEPVGTGSRAHRAPSRTRAAAAWDEGFYGDWVVPVPDTELESDETMRRDTSLEKLAKLKPAFAKDGTVTAGNSSPLNDGAGAMLLADEEGASLSGREPIARVVSRGVAAVDPDVFGIAPVEAANVGLKRAGIGWNDVSVVELNEAFASQCLADMSQWKDLDPDKVNPNGGAIALGHPLGASGVRILGSLAHELKRRGGGYGVAAICIGVGQGLAVVLEA
jgi:acetyl-CoA acyltransferase